MVLKIQSAAHALLEWALIKKEPPTVPAKVFANEHQAKIVFSFCQVSDLPVLYNVNKAVRSVIPHLFVSQLKCEKTVRLEDLYLAQLLWFKIKNEPIRLLEILDRFYASPTTLELSGNSFSEPNLKEIVQSKWWASLSAIHISDEPKNPAITDSRIEDLLRSCPNLREFRVKDCVEIRSKTFSALASSCRNITHVSIENCPNVGHLSLSIITIQLTELASLTYIGSPQIFQKYQISDFPKQDDKRKVHYHFEGDFLKKLHAACWQWALGPDDPA